VLAQFPRMPLTSAKMIAEDYWRKIRSRPFRKRDLEDCIVEHAMRCWTSYEFRVYDARQRTAVAREIIKPRMRDVLKSWLPPPEEIPVTGKDELLELFERHELLDSEEWLGEEDDGAEKWSALRYAGLRHFGGEETVANVTEMSFSRF
jgi:hypothetical protein